MKKYIKKLQLKIDEETKNFVIDQPNVTEGEIIALYKCFCEEYHKKLNMNEFIKALSIYGIDLISLNEELITIEL